MRTTTTNGLTPQERYGGVVIAGGGQAAFQLSASLRERGYKRPISIVGDEDCLPYQRPPLSKSFLVNFDAADELRFRPQSWYETNNVTFLHDTVVELDRIERKLGTLSGTRLDYDDLVLAMGASTRSLAIPGSDLAGVITLRKVADAEQLRSRIRPGSNVTVVGGSFLGLEVASTARRHGSTVTVLNRGSRLMQNRVTPAVSDHFLARHLAEGVQIRFETTPIAFSGNSSSVEAVHCSDGTTIAADLVVVCVGVFPNTTVASSSGLAVDRGVIVDSQLRTSDPAISAIGDCARFGIDSNIARIESVQNAIDQAKFVASRLTGHVVDYTVTPRFWSVQFDERLQIVGHTDRYDNLVSRIDRSGKALSVFAFHRDRLVGVESVNCPKDHVTARRILQRGLSINPSDAADVAFSLRDVR